jgi:ribosomal-protein-alanine N-acetyltransferase
LTRPRAAQLPAELETARLILRPYRFEDVEDVLGYASDEEWARYLEVVPHPYAKTDAVAFIARQVLLDRHSHATWALVFGESVVGGINIRFSLGHAVGEMGWSIARKLWNRGLMTEAASVVVDVAFATYPSLRRIRAMADARNTASHRVMTKVGMQWEGTLRQNRLVGGVLIDEAWFGILRAEWEALSRSS